MNLISFPFLRKILLQFSLDFLLFFFTWIIKNIFLWFNNCVGNTLEKKYKILISKLVKKLHTKHQKKQSYFHVFWSIWCLVCSFWPILKFYSCCFPQMYSVQKPFFLGSILSQSKSNTFVRNTFEKTAKKWVG